MTIDSLAHRLPSACWFCGRRHPAVWEHERRATSRGPVTLRYSHDQDSAGRVRLVAIIEGPGVTAPTVSRV